MLQTTGLHRDEIEMLVERAGVGGNHPAPHVESRTAGTTRVVEDDAARMAGGLDTRHHDGDLLVARLAVVQRHLKGGALHVIGGIVEDVLRAGSPMQSIAGVLSSLCHRGGGRS